MEFFTNDNEVWCQTENGIEQLNESNVELVNDLFNRIQNFYPDAYKALSEWYAKSAPNLFYFKFLCVQRFIKCNFGLLDTTTVDIDAGGYFHFEKVQCPMRGECKHEGCVCMPKFNSTLSDAEMRVMRLLYEGKTINEAAEALYISVNTARNHRKSAYTKLSIHSHVEFVKYANDNNLFK